MSTLQERGSLPKVLGLALGVGAVIAGRSILRSMSEADLSGQVALVTGGSRGLGYLVARELAREGCHVAICARDQEELDLAKAALTVEGHNILTHICDVADEAQVQRMVHDITNEWGRIDILVNNAGIIQFGPMQSMKRDDFKQAMDIMFWGTVHPTLAVIPQMRERQNGRIVNITSIGGKVSVPHLLPYSAAKFAATGFSEGLHTELKQDGISVTTILPGLMRTGSYFNAQFKGDTDKEFTWFSLGSSLPLITIDAERAAQQIVQATKRGEAERILSIPANLLARFNGLFPAATSRALGVINEFILPDPNGPHESAESGSDVQERLDSQAQRAATTLGREAARDFQPDKNLPEDVVIDPQT